MMIDKNTQEKIEFGGVIRSVQPRSMFGVTGWITAPTA